MQTTSRCRRHVRDGRRAVGPLTGYHVFIKEAMRGCFGADGAKAAAKRWQQLPDAEKQQYKARAATNKEVLRERLGPRYGAGKSARSERKVCPKEQLPAAHEQADSTASTAAAVRGGD
eukprot:TRINITY_DN3705_c0_g1_i3.p2 TRINITY_DN3705_c0_g1~~TRINITY_DN3705_c0_g1_i3.p2  ORF type:complete len:118 (+),score=22.05 TRINITY_DN3705_c0_g1_i3:600-953(+)